ncbi:hypothetical protein [Nodularia sp. NIES-3585]|uniref:hypothetical protein n=1 Tax=Nodularia sp. NIES-3585 TaxID=1973477 RepID=UPI000B75868E|nr:hypothetical protein [Nodularia sp. NIES-3585]GAX39013.1 hypothetical protein NIES3585_50650 [Nodularia sp. NIES-3585]
MGRRNNPDYTQLTALVPKELGKKFRLYCTDQEIQLTDAIEEAVREYLQKRGISS